MMKYREVICPSCKHRFMFQCHEDYDFTAVKNEKEYAGWFGDCPKCEKTLLVLDGILEGTQEDCFDVIMENRLR